MKTFLKESDFISKAEHQRAFNKRLLSCFIQKAEKTDDDKTAKENMDPDDETQHSESYEHHRLMTAFHAVKAEELGKEALALQGSTKPELHEEGKKRKGEAVRHTKAADEHRELAKGLYSEKEHGKWNDRTPTKAEALKYGTKMSKHADKKVAELEEPQDVKKGDLSYKLRSGKDNLVFSKKGSELKELASNKLTQLTGRKAALTGRLESLFGKLEEEKVEFRPSTDTDAFDATCPFPEIKWKDEYYKDEKIRALLDPYQNLCWTLRSITEDVKTLTTLVENIDEKKTYETSIDQLSSLEKSESSGAGSVDDLEMSKAEGSRGGKVIGHTKSGKPIYDYHSHEGHKDFTHGEHNEAAKTHFALVMEHRDKSIKEKDKNVQEGHKKAAEHHNKQVHKHMDDYLSEGHTKAEKESKEVKKSEAFDILGIK